MKKLNHLLAFLLIVLPCISTAQEASNNSSGRAADPNQTLEAQLSGKWHCVSISGWTGFYEFSMDGTLWITAENREPSKGRWFKKGDSIVGMLGKHLNFTLDLPIKENCLTGISARKNFLKITKLPVPGNSITPSAKPAGDRIWSQAETGKTITATLMGKSPDNSNVTLLIKGSPKSTTAATDTFSREDREYIANWVPSSETRVASDPNPTGAKSEQSPQGLVLRQPTVLDQGKGGFGIQIDELGEIMKPYGEPENDLAAHPGLVIYSGPAPKGGSCRITYLMKRAEAVEQLLGRTGLTIKLDAVTPGFPPGLSIYNYDRKFGDYDHMTLLVDDADQVVTLQFKSDSKAFGFLDGKWPIYNFKTLNYINLKAANGGRIQVRGRKNGEESVLVNIDHRGFRETVTWYVPKPLVRLILFNVREKQKVRK